MSTKEDKKNLSRDEIINQHRFVLSALKMKKKMGQLTQTHLIKKTKKDLARLLANVEKNKDYEKDL